MMMTKVIDRVLVVKEIAERFRDPEKVKNTILSPDNRNLEPISQQSRWDEISFGGYAALILLLAELDRLFPEEKWDETAHLYVLKIKQTIEREGIHQLSLFSGLAGTCFSLHQASRKGTRYQKLLSTLNLHLIKNVEIEYLTPLKENLEKGLPSSIFLYDLIQGIVGIGIYEISNVSQIGLLNQLQEILALLVRLTKPIQAWGRQVPGWYLPSSLQFLDSDKERYPKGNFNIGLAHGIPGILAFLSVAMLRGIIVEGQQEAIEYITSWIVRHRREENGIYCWETMLPFENETDGKNTPIKFHRAAWCYGVPGIVRALYLAGKATKNTWIKEFSLESFRSVFKCKRESWLLPGPSICHGICGLLLITWQMAKDSRLPDLMEQVPAIEEILLEYYQSKHPFGFKDYDLTKTGTYAHLDKVDLLEGACGILLTLLSLEHEVSWWHAPFLINHE